MALTDEGNAHLRGRSSCGPHGEKPGGCAAESGKLLRFVSVWLVRTVASVFIRAAVLSRLREGQVRCFYAQRLLFMSFVNSVVVQIISGPVRTRYKKTSKRNGLGSSNYKSLGVGQQAGIMYVITAMLQPNT